MIIDQVVRFMEAENMLSSGDAVLVACSGGPDSLALLDILLRLRGRYALRLAAAHVDHGLRGRASAADAAFVQAYCAQKGVPCYTTAVDVAAFQKAGGRSLEDAARILRYAFLRDAAEKLGNAKIATGHHRDDQAETVLLHLLRGAGGGGIAGIRPQGHGIIRPLLRLSRQKIERYCAEQGLLPRLDETNLVACCLRNRIRLELLPQLAAQFNGNVREALCRTAELVGAEHDFVRHTVKEQWERLATAGPGRAALDKRLLLALHAAQRREAVRMAAEAAQGHVRGLSFEHVEKILALAAGGRTGAVLELPGGLRAACGYTALTLFAAPPAAVAAAAAPPRVLAAPGRTEIPELGVAIEAAVRTSGRAAGRAEAVFDYAALQGPLYVRTRRDGDRVRLTGMDGAKKLKDFLIDAKVPRSERDRVPLVCDGRGILWIAGYRQTSLGKATAATERYLLLRLETLGGKTDD